ncbi:MAG: hypothetical protein KAT90_02130 [Gammaproteobacteria bacterium]|nr:hypothetical protein [Gammaproteobacteria bacterium]
MKNNKIVVDRCLEQLEAKIENFMKSISFDDVIRMHFLEQSAKYLGVYVENNPIDLGNRVKN